jgi:DNA-binding SARP family transcriptional activator
MSGSMPATASADESPHWRLRLCGPPQAVSAHGTRVVLDGRDAVMLALLAIDGPTARTRIAAHLWPNEPIEQTRGRLRQRIHTLKRKLGVDAVVGGATLALAPALTWSGFEQEPANGRLLGDDDHAERPEFAEWLDATRQRLRSLRREVLAGQASSLEEAGRLAEAIVAAEDLLALEPLQEHAHRRLMRLHYLRGDRSAALLAFDRCEQVLKDDVGARPSDETLELLAQIERSPAPATGLAPRRVPAAVLRPPRLIGRDAEWTRLQEAWADRHAITLIGEAGMGKTRLLSDLVLAQAPGPGRALHVSARPGDERVPFALLGRMVRGVLALRDTPLAEGVEAELSRLLPELPQRAAAEHIAGARARLVGALETTLAQAVGAGLEAVVLDDLHFADPGSLEMAQHLAGIDGLRWLTAFRGSEAGDAARQLVDALASLHGTDPIELRPLTSAQVGDLVGSLGIDGLDAAALAHALHRRTGGNPLFLLETLKALLSQGAGAGAASLGPGALARMPATASIGRLIARRLEGLSPAALKLVQCAAVAGQDFSVDLAVQLLGVRAIDLAAPWDELEAAQVIEDRAFAHDLIHDAALASVPRPVARSLHGAVADWLDTHEPDAEPARLAHHWQQAARPGRAGPAWFAAAGRCAARGRRVEQAQLLEQAARAFEAAGDGRARSQALLLRAQVIGEHSDLASAREALALAVSSVGDDDARLRLAVISVSVLGFHGGDDHVLAQSPAALEMAQRLSRPDQALVVLRVYCGALARAARAAEGLELLDGLRPWLDAHGSAEQRHEFWNARALALDHGGRMRESMQAWETARGWAERYGSDLLCQVIGNMAITSAKMGDMRRAAELGEQALTLARGASDGFEHQVLEQALALGRHRCNIGHFGDAVRLLESALAGFGQGERDRKLDLARCALSVAWLHLGQPARALQLTAAESASPHVGLRAMRLAFRALALQASGQAAVGPIREALAMFHEPEALWYRTHCLIATALLPPHEGEPLALALASWAMRGERFGLALAAHARAGRCALAGGAAGRALPHVEAAMQLARTHQPDVFYLPELWWVAAQVYAALGRDASRQAVVREGARWVTRVAAQHVPAEFRQSFLHRNPVNAALIHWAHSYGYGLVAATETAAPLADFATARSAAQAPNPRARRRRP